jgi:hypothetical protein
MAETTTVTPTDTTVSLTNSECIEDNKETAEQIKARWTNRRRMAWVSLITIIVLIQETIFLGTGLSESKLEALSSVINTGIFVLATLVGAYMGLATFAEAGFWKTRK